MTFIKYFGLGLGLTLGGGLAWLLITNQVALVAAIVLTTMVLVAFLMLAVFTRAAEAVKSPSQNFSYRGQLPTGPQHYHFADGQAQLPPWSAMETVEGQVAEIDEEITA